MDFNFKVCKQYVWVNKNFEKQKHSCNTGENKDMV